MSTTAPRGDGIPRGGSQIDEEAEKAPLLVQRANSSSPTATSSGAPSSGATTRSVTVRAATLVVLGVALLTAVVAASFHSGVLSWRRQADNEEHGSLKQVDGVYSSHRRMSRGDATTEKLRAKLIKAKETARTNELEYETQQSALAEAAEEAEVLREQLEDVRQERLRDNENVTVLSANEVENLREKLDDLRQAHARDDAELREAKSAQAEAEAEKNRVEVEAAAAKSAQAEAEAEVAAAKEAAHYISVVKSKAKSEAAKLRKEVDELRNAHPDDDTDSHAAPRIVALEEQLHATQERVANAVEKLSLIHI